MFIDKSMTKDVVAVGPEMGIIEAREIMVQKGIRHLPVVGDGDILVGIVTDRDMRTAMPSAVLFDAEKAAGMEKLAGH